MFDGRGKEPSKARFGDQHLGDQRVDLLHLGGAWIPATRRRTSSPDAVRIVKRAADPQAVVVGEALFEHGAVAAESRQDRVGPLAPVQVEDAAEVGGDSVDERFVAEDLGFVAANVGDQADARRPRQRRAGGRRERFEAVLRGDDVVGVDRALERFAVGGAQAGAERRDDGDQRQPTISAAAVRAVRIGLRVAFSLARRPASPPKRRAGAPTAAASGRHRGGRGRGRRRRTSRGSRRRSARSTRSVSRPPKEP